MTHFILFSLSPLSLFSPAFFTVSLSLSLSHSPATSATLLPSLSLSLSLSIYRAPFLRLTLREGDTRTNDTREEEKEEKEEEEARRIYYGAVAGLILRLATSNTRIPCAMRVHAHERYTRVRSRLRVSVP